MRPPHIAGGMSVSHSGLSPLILIVDDDLSTTFVLDELLRKAGFSTVCTCDISGAKTLIASRSVSLILLDVHLPDGNGLELCAQLSPSSGIPILFISANDDVDTKVRSFMAGGVDYITKPLSCPEVLARVRTHLRLKAAYDSLAQFHAERIQHLAISQQALMPLSGNLPDARFHAVMRQVVQAGGDFYDVIPSGSKVTDYVLADASGHDLGSSLWTASFKTLLSVYASVLYSPQDGCRMINTTLRRILPEGTYFTAIYARLNRASGKLTLVNAGHPPAIHVSAKTRETEVLHQSGDVIGSFNDAVFGVLERNVQPGDRLFLYSDGLIELTGSRKHGIHLLREHCRTAARLPLQEAVAYIVEQMCSCASPEDDIVLMGTEI
jgi:sigma-B regulation protein RsbU (phosphoserine phosphatase)